MEHSNGTPEDTMMLRIAELEQEVKRLEEYIYEFRAIALRAMDELEQAKKDMAYQAENWQAAEDENERLRAFGRAWKTLAKQLKIEQERLRNALELSYVRIGDPPDGEPLQYLGCYISRWQRQWTDIVGEENVSGFRRYDPELEAAAQAVEGRDDE